MFDRELAIEYRFRSDHRAHVFAQARDDFYGPDLRVQDDEHIGIAVTLLRDALDRPEHGVAA